MSEPISVSPFAQPSASAGMPLDWLSALLRLQQGRVSDPSEDKLFASTSQPWQWGRTDIGTLAGETQGGILNMYPQFRPAAQSGSAEAVPFGDMADPVSQLAVFLAPILARGLASIATESIPSVSLLQRGILSNQRGGVGGGKPSSLDELRRLHEQRYGINRTGGGLMPRPRDMSLPAVREPVANIEELRSLYARYIEDDLKTYQNVRGGVKESLEQLKAMLPELSDDNLVIMRDILYEHGNDWNRVLRGILGKTPKE